MAKTLPSFQHPRTGAVYPDAYLRLTCINMNEPEKIGRFRFDVWASKSLWAAGKEPVWDGSIEVSGQLFLQGMARVLGIGCPIERLDSVIYDFAASANPSTQLVVRYNDALVVPVLDGAIENPD